MLASASRPFAVGPIPCFGRDLGGRARSLGRGKHDRVGSLDLLRLRIEIPVFDPNPGPNEAPLFGPEEPDSGVGFAPVLVEDRPGTEQHAREATRRVWPVARETGRTPALWNRCSRRFRTATMMAGFELPVNPTPYLERLIVRQSKAGVRRGED